MSFSIILINGFHMLGLRLNACDFVERFEYSVTDIELMIHTRARYEYMNIWISIDALNRLDGEECFRPLMFRWTVNVQARREPTSTQHQIRYTWQSEATVCDGSIPRRRGSNDGRLTIYHHLTFILFWPISPTDKLPAHFMSRPLIMNDVTR